MLSRLFRSLMPIRAPRGAEGKTIFSFVIDSHPKFAYQGYHLAMSILHHCRADPHDINVQFLPEVNTETRNFFARLGFRIHEVQRFGDGRYCNKISQLRSIKDDNFDRIILLDTDMIFVADPRPFLPGSALSAKVVDAPNPSAQALQEIASAAGMKELPPVIAADNGAGHTYSGNCNGGFYVIPKAVVHAISEEWPRWALWLLENSEPLERERKRHHVDQVAMWLAINMAKIPFLPLSSNLNYYIHFRGAHIHYDASKPIAVLHYHDASMNVLGLLETKHELDEHEKNAVWMANEQLRRSFINSVFWDFRYSMYPDRGSGVGSRGNNLIYKRDILKQEGIEEAESVLDVGCGDLEIVKIFEMNDYLGIDCSDAALARARLARPDLALRAVTLNNHFERIPKKDLVLCLEVLIHQETRESYEWLIQLLANKTAKKLLVSGYDSESVQHARNHMVFFHEPLSESLQKARRFRSIERVGGHTDVSIFRCVV